MDKRVVWITGGGSGLGAACAHEYARRGALVVVSGRRAERLDEVVAAIEAQGGAAAAVPCDVSDDDAVREAVARVVADHGRIDVVVANAGFGLSGWVAKLSDAELRRQFDVNVFGVLNTARHSLPELHKTGGRLGIVSSVAGFLSVPGTAAYCASKAAVSSFGASLALEQARKGVSVTTIHPGYVESEIGQVDNQGRFDASRQDPRPKLLLWKTAKAASVMVDAIEDRKGEFIFTAHGKAIVLLARWFPSLLRFVMSRT